MVIKKIIIDMTVETTEMGGGIDVFGNIKVTPKLKSFVPTIIAFGEVDKNATQSFIDASNLILKKAVIESQEKSRILSEMAKYSNGEIGVIYHLDSDWVVIQKPEELDFSCGSAELAKSFLTKDDNIIQPVMLLNDAVRSSDFAFSLQLDSPVTDENAVEIIRWFKNHLSVAIITAISLRSWQVSNRAMESEMPIRQLFASTSVAVGVNNSSSWI